MAIEDPLIVILGSTATGKSKLAISLAKVLAGEIISADSMQVYRGLDIITNKVTAEEGMEVPHHMMNLVSPPQEYTVVQYKHHALKIIEEVHRKKRLPILVGGTNYYIESLLWDFLVDKEKEEDMFDTSKCLKQRKHTEDMVEVNYSEQLESEKSDMYGRLMEVDPERAEALHPRNIRKVARSLQIYEATGKKHSALLKEQKACPGSSYLSGPLRFTQVLVFWLTCKQEELDQRISDRMEKMVEQGLKNEITQFYRNYLTPHGENMLMNSPEFGNSSNEIDGNNILLKKKPTLVEEENSVSLDICTEETGFQANSDTGINKKSYEDGLFQAIGFKEFHSFVTCTDDDPQKLEILFREGLERLRCRTIKYSKKQVKWVRNRFLGRPADNMLPVYELDTTDAEGWAENVLQRALDIAHAFIQRDKIPYSCMDAIDSSSCDSKRKYTCELCDGRIIMGDLQWKEHLVSKKHKWCARKRKRGLDDSEGRLINEKRKRK